jgi:dihydrofolate reductase
MRRVRYRVASSLDGFVSGPNGEVDWIIKEPEMDFAAIMSEFDTLLVGRRTFELMERAGRATTPGMSTIVFSSTLQQTAYPQVTIVRTGEKEVITALREETGRDIWLFGGPWLFSSLANQGLVDTVELAVMPVLLGKGVPLGPQLAKTTRLRLLSQRTYKSGILMLEYAT